VRTGPLHRRQGAEKLRQEFDPFLERLDEDYHPDTPQHDRVRSRHGAAGDRYRLLVPAAYADVAAWRRWKPGKLGAVHPVFRDQLGGPAALVYEHLGVDDTKGLELAQLAGLSPTATNHTLRQLPSTAWPSAADTAGTADPSTPTWSPTP
jgi:hypothetical protein